MVALQSLAASRKTFLRLGIHKSHRSNQKEVVNTRQIAMRSKIYHAALAMVKTNEPRYVCSSENNPIMSKYIRSFPSLFTHSTTFIYVLSSIEQLPLRHLRQLLQLPLLLIRQQAIQLIETGNILRGRAHEELSQISLRLVIALSHEATADTLSVGHQVGFGGAGAEVQHGGYVLPGIVVVFVGEVGGGEGGGGVLDAGRGEELFDEDFDDFEGCGDDGVLIWVWM